MRIKARNFIAALIIIMTLGLISFINGNNIWAMLVLSLYTVIVAFCAQNADKHIVLLMYSGCFFVFVVGGIIVKEYFGYDMIYDFSEEYYNYMIFSVFLSLLFIVAGYVFFENVHIKKRNSISDQSAVPSKKIKLIRRISYYCQFLFLIAYVAELIESIIAVSRFGYSEYYTYESNMPYIVAEMSELYIVALFLFLSTLPEKKEAKIPLAVFFIINCLSLLTGRRLYFVVDNMIIICYCFFRNKLSPEDKWITFRHIFIMILAFPFIAVFLFTYRYIRVNAASAADSVFDAFFLFFRQQGFSANLIPLGKMYASNLSDNIYSLYDVLRTIRLNPIVRLITNSYYRKMYTGSKEALALNSGSFARAISYAVVRTRYINGYGMGSCYIAELYHDFGYIGICVGNFIYGLTIAKIKSLSTNRIIRNTFVLLMIRGFFRAPRYCFDSPYYMLLSLEIWVFIGLVFALSGFLNKKNNLAAGRDSNADFNHYIP